MITVLHTFSNILGFLCLGTCELKYRENEYMKKFSYCNYAVTFLDLTTTLRGGGGLRAEKKYSLLIKRGDSSAECK